MAPYKHPSSQGSSFVSVKTTDLDSDSTHRVWTSCFVRLASCLGRAKKPPLILGTMLEDTGEGVPDARVPQIQRKTRAQGLVGPDRLRPAVCSPHRAFGFADGRLLSVQCSRAMLASHSGRVIAVPSTLATLSDDEVSTAVVVVGCRRRWRGVGVRGMFFSASKSESRKHAAVEQENAAVEDGQRDPAARQDMNRRSDGNDQHYELLCCVS